jgi:hypothetical protein
MDIQLNEKELNYALDLAIKRHDAKHISFRNKDTERFANTTKTNIAGKMNVDKQYMAHFLGVLGELGWAMATGDVIDSNIYSVRDGGEDFSGIEVKTITYAGNGEPELKIPVEEYETRKPPKMYVLTRFNSDKNIIQVLGKITRENFDRVKTKRRYAVRKPMNYIVPLSKMEKL